MSKDRNTIEKTKIDDIIGVLKELNCSYTLEILGQVKVKRLLNKKEKK